MKKPKFKPGDKVRVNIKKAKKNIIKDIMKKYEGKELTITEIIITPLGDICYFCKGMKNSYIYQEVLERPLNREWVIASLKHAKNGVIQFYGTYTEDNAEKRCTSVYNEDFETCERFTLQELQHYEHLPFFGDGPVGLLFSSYEATIKIRIRDLPNLATKKTVFKIV